MMEYKTDMNINIIDKQKKAEQNSYDRAQNRQVHSQIKLHNDYLKNIGK